MITNTGSLTPSMLTTPSKPQISGSCTTRNSYNVPNTTKTMALLMTSTSSLRLTPH
jgi:hypothetical protein